LRIAEGGREPIPLLGSRPLVQAPDPTSPPGGRTRNDRAGRPAVRRGAARESRGRALAQMSIFACPGSPGAPRNVPGRPEQGHPGHQLRPRVFERIRFPRRPFDGTMPRVPGDIPRPGAQGRLALSAGLTGALAPSRRVSRRDPRPEGLHRRRRAEREAAERASCRTAAVGCDDVASIVHEEVDQLPERYLAAYQTPQGWLSRTLTELPPRARTECPR
jgi:hypothetical protein